MWNASQHNEHELKVSIIRALRIWLLSNKETIR